MHLEFHGTAARLLFGMAFFGLASQLFAQQALQQVSSPAPLPTTAAASVLPDAPLPQIELAAAADPQSGQAQSTQQPASGSAPAQNSTGQSQSAQPPAKGTDPAPAAPGSVVKNAVTQNCPTSQTSSSSQQPCDQGRVAGTSNDRLFYTLPNFLTLQQTGKLPPLTVGQKFKVVALGNFDPVQYPWWGLLAAISQADDGDPAYGQGWIAYAKRYGTTAGDSSVENFMVGAVFPSILHQDPRFYQSSQGGYVHRAGYAISRIVVTRTDSGRSQFNYSEIFGAALAAAISTYTYHPRSTYISTPTNPHLFVPSERTLANTTSTWGTQVGLDTITIVIKEFWPDIHRKLSHKSGHGPAASPGPNGD